MKSLRGWGKNEGKMEKGTGKEKGEREIEVLIEVALGKF